MTLHTDLPGFMLEHHSRFPEVPVYIAVRAGQTIVTAADTGRNILLVAQSGESRAHVESLLLGAKIQAKEGLWMEDGSPLVEHHPTWIAGVSYKSEGGQPGIWLDAWSVHPSPSDVIGRLYAEFVRDGVIAEMGVEQFTSAAETHVVILSPEEITSFVEKNSRGF